MPESNFNCSIILSTVRNDTFRINHIMEIHKSLELVGRVPRPGGHDLLTWMMNGLFQYNRHVFISREPCRGGATVYSTSCQPGDDKAFCDRHSFRAPQELAERGMASGHRSVCAELFSGASSGLL